MSTPLIERIQKEHGALVRELTIDCQRALYRVIIDETRDIRERETAMVELSESSEFGAELVATFLHLTVLYRAAPKTH